MIFTRRTQALPVELRALGTLLIVMLLARLGADAMPRQVPFLAFLEAAGSAEEWVTACKYIFLTGAALVLSGVAIQAGCAVAGVALILKVLGNMPLYSNGRLFDGLILLLIGLYTPKYGLRFLRVQCYLLYAGAVLGKVIDPDWWDGRFVDVMLQSHLPPAQYAVLHPFATAAGWLTIVAESACLLLLAIPRTRWAGVLTVAVFHTSLLVVLDEDFGSFYYTVALCAVLLFLPMPSIRMIHVPGAWWARLCQHAAFTPFREAPLKIGGPPSVSFITYEYRGWAATLVLLLTSLPVAGVLVATVAYVSRLGYWRLRDVLIGSMLAITLVVWRARKSS